MDFEISCTCGATIRVSSVDAGGTKQCRCGNILVVPSLSELRRRSGQQAFCVNIADRLQTMFAAGELPVEKHCTQCGVETSNTLPCTVVCERPYTKGRGFWATALLMLLTPVWILGAVRRDHMNPEVHGRELIVNTPLTLCPACAAEARKRKARLRELLHRVPLYDQLLNEYPQADCSA
jgi:hypothetical protein